MFYSIMVIRYFTILENSNIGRDIEQIIKAEIAIQVFTKLKSELFINCYLYK